MSLYPINPKQFVEKYKLIPKNLRENLLAFVYQMPRNSSSNEEDYDEIYDNTFMYLRVYELWNKDNEDYRILRDDLETNVYFGASYVYADIANALLNCLRWKSKVITKEDVYRFRKNLILRDIKEIVAYRFGNVGYELARDHFYSLCKLYQHIC